jgi:hypothetical protein
MTSNKNPTNFSSGSIKDEDISIYKTTRDVLLNLIQCKEDEINEAISIQRQLKEELIKLDLNQFEEAKNGKRKHD